VCHKKQQPRLGANSTLSGCETEVSALGFRISLHGNSFVCSTGRLWPDEITKRLYESIFYALEGIDVGLLVEFILTSSYTAAKPPQRYLGLSELSSSIGWIDMVTISSYLDREVIPSCFDHEWRKRGLPFSPQMKVVVLQKGKKWELQDGVSSYTLQLEIQINVFAINKLLFSLVDDYYTCSLNNDILPEKMTVLLQQHGYSVENVSVGYVEQNVWQVYFANNSLYIVKEKDRYYICAKYNPSKTIVVYQGLPQATKPVTI
jgi:hypothetical protein